MARDDAYEAWPLFVDVIGTGDPKLDRDVRYGTGIKTRHDAFVIGWDGDDAISRVKQVAGRSESDDELIQSLGLCTTAHFSVGDARRRASGDDLADHVRPIAYRPFDRRELVYLREFVCEPKLKTMRPMLAPENVAMAVLRRDRKENGSGFFVSRGLVAKDLVSNLDDAVIWPLYIPADDESLIASSNGYLEPNVASFFIDAIRSTTALAWCNDAEGDLKLTFGPRNVFAYIYAILFSSGYRKRYAQFLKIDFPRLPLPNEPDLFADLSRFGAELVEIHLMESSRLNRMSTTYVGPTGPNVGRIGWSEDVVLLDAPTKNDHAVSEDTVGFHGVPEGVWKFHIGAYQVCDKWLKDRKGRALSDDDIAHYQKIVVALSETIRIMAEIDGVIEEHGGWPSAFAINHEASGCVNAFSRTSPSGQATSAS